MKIHPFLAIASIACVVPAYSATHAVKAGENMYRIALRHNTSVAALQAANPQAKISALKIGQQLVIPGKPQAAVAAVAAATPRPKQKNVAVSGSHSIAAGETFSSIARSLGISVADLQALNPTLNSNSLRIDQVIKVGGRATSRPTAAQMASTNPTLAPRHENVAPIVEKRLPFAKKEIVQEVAVKEAPEVAKNYTIPAPAPVTEPVLSEIQNSASMPILHQNAPAFLDSKTESEIAKLGVTEPKESKEKAMRLIKTTRELTLQDFAKEHETTTDLLNSINGWNFPPNTLLAVDSELLIPVQP